MLYVARQARVANRYAPRQTRRVNAEAATLGLFGADMATWLDVYRSTAATGSTISSTPDCSYNKGTITQATAAKRPLSSVNSNGGVKGFVFDGLDDGLQTSTLTLNSTVDMTCLALTMQGTKTTDTCIAESGYVTGPNGVIFYRAANLAVRSPATYMNMTAGPGGGRGGWASVAYAANVWLQHTHVAKRTAAYADQIRFYGGGSVLPYGNFEASSGGTFADNYFNLFWREYLAPTGSLYFEGTVVQLILLKRALSAEEAVVAYRLLYEIAGLEWT